MAAPAVVPAAVKAALLDSDVGLTKAGWELKIGGLASALALGGWQSALSLGKKHTKFADSAWVEGVVVSAVTSKLGLVPTPPVPPAGQALLDGELLDLDDAAAGVGGIFDVAALFPAAARAKLLRALKCAMAKMYAIVVLPDFQATVMMLGSATLATADMVVLANCAATTINMSNDPAQDAGIVMRLHKARKSAMIQCTLTTTGGAGAVAVAVATGGKG